MLQVRLDDGTELIFLGTTLDEPAPLVADIEDYRHGRLSYAQWFPSSGDVLRYGRRLSGRPAVLQDLGPLPAPARDAMLNLILGAGRVGCLVIAALLVAGGALGAQTPRQEVPGNVLLVERDDPNDLRAVRVPDRDPVQPNGFYGPGVIVWTIGASDYNVYSRSVRAYFAGLQFATFGDGLRGYWVLASASGVPNPRYGPDGLIPRVVGFPDGHLNFNAGDDIVPAPPHTMRALRLDGVDVGPTLAELQARLEALERRVR